jgi:molybdopterin-guanine dinucleotide biosynthesis protein A
VSAADCAALVLAGGRSARMGGRNKALVSLAGQPMLAHVLARLQGQAGQLGLAVAPGQPGVGSFGLPLVADHARRHRGPLAGLHAGLGWAAAQPGVHWLLLVPCDGPFLPRNLLAVLKSAAQTQACGLAVARYEQQLQPTFSLWQLDHAPAVEQALAHGQGGLMRLLKSLPYVAVDWPRAEPEPFFNVNSPADLEQAAAWLDPGRGQA